MPNFAIAFFTILDVSRYVKCHITTTTSSGERIMQFSTLLLTSSVKNVQFHTATDHLVVILVKNVQFHIATSPLACQ